MYEALYTCISVVGVYISGCIGSVWPVVVAKSISKRDGKNSKLNDGECTSRGRGLMTKRSSRSENQQQNPQKFRRHAHVLCSYAHISEILLLKLLLRTCLQHQCLIQFDRLMHWEAARGTRGTQHGLRWPNSHTAHVLQRAPHHPRPQKLRHS